MKLPRLIAFVIASTIIAFFLMDKFYGAIYFAGTISGMYYMDELIEDRQRRNLKDKRMEVKQ